MFKKVLFAVAAVLAVLLAFVATRPSAYHVERTLEIAAPADRVFGVLDDLHGFMGVFVVFGSPWEELDPDVQKTFEGPAAGVGQSCAWTGNSDVGKGRITIEQSVPGQKVGVKLAFEEPMESLATLGLTIATTPTGSRVTWSMDGDHNFVGRAFGLFVDMDEMLGADIEMGLARLRRVAEARQ